MRLLLRKGIANLPENFDEEVKAATNWSMTEVKGKAPDGSNVGLMYQPTVVSLLDKEPLPGMALGEILRAGH